MCIYTYVYVYCNCKQFDFHKLVCYIRSPLNSGIYHYLFYVLNVLQFHKCFLIILTTIHVCVRFYEGPLRISASALNGIPSINKDYLI